MKYIVTDCVNGDIFTDEYSTKEAAINAARNEWEHLSEYDKRRRTAFYVLESINPDPDADDHADGDIVFELK